DQGLEVFVVADAVASRTSDRMEVALASLRAGGIRVEHSETILYGLLGAADHPAFREVLGLVKGSRY
ncbi:MAG: hydrolase, partial [Armatimonadota bacterium]